MKRKIYQKISIFFTFLILNLSAIFFTANVLADPTRELRMTNFEESSARLGISFECLSLASKLLGGERRGINLGTMYNSAKNNYLYHGDKILMSLYLGEAVRGIIEVAKRGNSRALGYAINLEWERVVEFIALSYNATFITCDDCLKLFKLVYENNPRVIEMHNFEKEFVDLGMTTKNIASISKFLKGIDFNKEYINAKRQYIQKGQKRLMTNFLNQFVSVVLGLIENDHAANVRNNPQMPEFWHIIEKLVKLARQYDFFTQDDVDNLSTRIKYVNKKVVEETLASIESF